MVNHEEEEEEDNEDECSFAPPNDQESMSKLQHYKTEANVNKEKFFAGDDCWFDRFINNNLKHVNRPLLNWEKRFIPWKNELNNCNWTIILFANKIPLISLRRRNNEHRQTSAQQHDNSSTNPTDHRVNLQINFHEEFFLFLVHSRTISFMYQIHSTSIEIKNTCSQSSWYENIYPTNIYGFNPNSVIESEKSFFSLSFEERLCTIDCLLKCFNSLSNLWLNEMEIVFDLKRKIHCWSSVFQMNEWTNGILSRDRHLNVGFDDSTTDNGRWWKMRREIFVFIHLLHCLNECEEREKKIFSVHFIV